MKINRRFFPEISIDNDETFLAHLTAIIESVDELCSLEITRTPKTINFRLAPSVPRYSQPLLEEILKLHNLFHIKVEMSKSMRVDGTITFFISL